MSDLLIMFIVKHVYVLMVPLIYATFHLSPCHKLLLYNTIIIDLIGLLYNETDHTKLENMLMP